MSELRRMLSKVSASRRNSSMSHPKMSLAVGGSLVSDYLQKKSASVFCSPEQKVNIDLLEQLIENATSDYIGTEDWNKNVAVIDKLNSITSVLVKTEAVRVLRMRMLNSSPTVVIYALILTEAIVKNCGRSIHRLIAQPKFMATLELLYKEHSTKRGRESMEISSRILDMIQAWGEAFLPYRSEFPLFSDTYHKMRKNGVVFPTQYDETRAPVLSPSNARLDSAPRNSRQSFATGISHFQDSFQNKCLNINAISNHK